MGVISSVTCHTEWVSSLVTVVKPDKIQLCIDMKNLNEAVKREHYPMKTIESVLTRLPEAKVFSTLDAASRFWQIPLDEESSLLTCFNTPFGRYKFNRLPFGIKLVPEVFQRTMEELLNDIEGCDIIVDDLIVWGRNDEEHDQHLINVLDRAREVQLKLNKKKCKIRVEEVPYIIGHTLTLKGLKLSYRCLNQLPSKILQRFMRLIQYLSKCIPKLSEKAAPLQALMKKNAAWSWNHGHQVAFQELKEECSKQPTLR